MKQILVICILAWFITTSQIVEVQDMNGKYPVVYKTYCTEEEPSYKTNGDILVRDSGKNVILRASHYTVEKVDRCK